MPNLMICLLKMADAHVAGMSGAEPTTNLEHFGLEKMAASTQLQRAYSQLTSTDGLAEGATGCESSLQLGHDGKVFQNEALIVALLQVNMWPRVA